LTALRANALTTLARLKTALGISGSSYDDYLSRLINAVSQYIENQVGRKLYYQTVTEEEIRGEGQKRMYVEVTPLILITSITYDDADIATANYEIVDADTGAIGYKYGNWNWSADAIENILSDIYPGSERKLYKVTYVGGYVTPKVAVAATITGSQAGDFTFAIDATLTITTEYGATTVSIGAGTYTAAEIVALIEAAVVANYDEITPSVYNTSYVRIAHDEYYAENVITLSGTACATLGLATTQAAGTRTLPADLEQLCIDLCAMKYARMGSDPTIKSERLMSYAVTYGFSELPLEMQTTINAHKRWFA
jgi:hypothetical protein